ncbi:tyrosinase-like protein 2 [Mytilus californianus]|uniref:tyrosinase-like protein 2 n=1 Tax=Mytilus californianus TaxID=6549 RepID=UPI0022478C79|nr:tyrosinase-like protein 2 [Mytilus californianus]
MVANAFLCLISIVIQQTQASIKTIYCPPKYNKCLSERSSNARPKDVPGEEIVSYCINQFLWEDPPFDYKKDSKVLDFVKQMFEQANMKKKKRPRLVRKEYRMLTKKEREDYHAAVNRLKNDKKSISFITTTFKFPILRLYETALGMACPYWDPTLDNELNNPSDSCLFTKKFAGNPNGKIGLPYDNWKHEGGGYVTRNVGGLGGELLTKKNVYDVLSRKRHAQITNSKSRRYFLEELHGKCHSFVGGNMAKLTTAPQDPLFWNLHAFVDCWWEKFRQKQNANRINPEKDYPYTKKKGHRRYDLMDGFGKITNQGFGISDKFTISDKANDFKKFRNIDGFSNHFTKEIYQCQSFPSCSRSKPSCGSPWLDCNKSKWVCVPKTNKANLNRLDSTPSFLNTVQNRFEVNGNADSKQWVYINCLIVFQRPRNVKFKSFPIHKGVPSNKNDIYFEGSKNITKSNPKAYDKHITLDSGFERVNVHIEGTNYDGRAIEYAIVDARFGISEAMTYLPVRKPMNHKATHVLLTAFDSGGRLCRPYCRHRRYRKKFVPCTGCLKIDTRKPRMYSYSYVESVSKRWNLHNTNDKNCPRSNDDGVYIKFFCNFLDLWPWEKA